MIILCAFWWCGEVFNHEGSQKCTKEKALHVALDFRMVLGWCAVAFMTSIQRICDVFVGIGACNCEEKS